MRFVAANILNAFAGILMWFAIARLAAEIAHLLFPNPNTVIVTCLFMLVFSPWFLRTQRKKLHEVRNAREEQNSMTVAAAVGFKEDGFLGKEAELYPEQYRKAFPRLFQFAERTDKLLHSTKLQLVANAHDLRSLFVAALYLRITHSFAAVLLLVQRGMTTDAEVVARSFLEAVMTLVAMKEDPEFAQAYANSFDANRANRIRQMLAKPERFSLSEDDKAKLSAVAAELKALMEATKTSSIKAEAKALKSKLETIYDYPYSVFSSSVHAEPDSLQRFFLLKEDGKPRAIFGGPWLDEIPKILTDTITGASITMLTTAELFSFDAPDVKGFATEWQTYVREKKPQSSAPEFATKSNPANLASKSPQQPT